MMQFCWTRHLRQFALGGAIGLALVAGAPSSLHAQDDDNGWSIGNIERRVWNGFVRGLGLRSADDPVIEYRERSPLVVPPTRELPPPTAKTAAKNPAWPVDPDVARQRKRADGKRKSPAEVARGVERHHEALTPEELNPPGATTTGSAGKAPGPLGDLHRPLQPSELGYFGGLFSFKGFGNRTEIGTFTSEPPRTTLTAPPSGYQTPSSAQPYGMTPRIKPKIRPVDPNSE